MKVNKVSLLLSLSLILSVGCQSPVLNKEQRRAVSQFSQSAQVVSGQASEEFQTIRAEVIEMNKLVASFSESWDANDQDFDKALDKDDTLARVRAVNALRSYAELLTAFVDDWEDEKLKGAAADFVNNVRKLDENQKISNSYLDVFEKAVLGIGRFLVERKKKQAVVAVVAMSKEQVDHLCNLLIQDFSGAGGYTTQLVTTAGSTMVAADTYLRKSEDPAGRNRAVEAFDRGKLAMTRHNEVHYQIALAAKAMKRANDNLSDVLEEKEVRPFKSFSHFKQLAEELAETAQYYTR